VSAKKGAGPRAGLQAAPDVHEALSQVRSEARRPPGPRVALDSGEEARALTRPAMTLARAEPRIQLTRQITRASRRWLHLSSRRRTGDSFL
jgi:hypothetical protein